MEEVVLYSTGCPRCRILKQKLDAGKVQYREETSVDKMLELGISQVPVLNVDGRILSFADAVNWANRYNKVAGGKK